MRYFAEPHLWSTYVTKGPACHFCHREGPGYEGPYYGCSGDTEALHAQLAAQSLTAAQRKTLLAERTRALEGRTPRLITWQDLLWPAHCSDYCRFVKEVGRKDVEKLAGDDDPQSWLEEHLEESTQESTDIDDLWESITPKSLDRPSKWGLCVYLFECVTCGEPVLLWDSE